MTANAKLVVGVTAAAVLALQAVPVDRVNPRSGGEAALPPPDGEVEEILRAACYDCHSHETEWPWYSRVAPASFFVSSHVEEGRENLNFSTWMELDARDRARGFGAIERVVEEGEMPLASYTLLHPEARLGEARRRRLIEWASARKAALLEGSRGELGEDGADGG